MKVKHTKTLLFIFLLSSTSIIKSQVRGDIFTYLIQNTDKGKIQVYQSESLKSAFYNYNDVQKKSALPNGFRICIFADTGQDAKKNAENARTRFLSQYENINCYTTFKYPWYRVYVGDFRTKSETIKNLKNIEREFPGAYFVPENISSSLD